MYLSIQLFLKVIKTYRINYLRKSNRRWWNVYLTGPEVICRKNLLIRFLDFGIAECCPYTGKLMGDWVTKIEIKSLTVDWHNNICKNIRDIVKGYPKCTSKFVWNHCILFLITLLYIVILMFVWTIDWKWFIFGLNISL